MNSSEDGPKAFSHLAPLTFLIEKKPDGKYLARWTNPLPSKIEVTANTLEGLRGAVKDACSVCIDVHRTIWPHAEPSPEVRLWRNSSLKSPKMANPQAPTTS